MLPLEHPDRIQIAFDVTVQTGENSCQGHEWNNTRNR